MNHHRTEMLNMLYDRLSATDPRYTKDKKIYNHSFDDLVYIHENSEPRTLLFSIETMINDVRWPQYWLQNDHLNFYDLVLKGVEERYPDYFNNIRKRIDNGKAYNHVEKIKGALSQTAEIDNLIDARDSIFNAIKSRERSKVIDITHLGHLSYIGDRGSLAYLKTINDPNYTKIRDSDDMFKIALSKGVFHSKKPFSIISLFTGAGYLENAWAESLGARRRLFIDYAGLSLHYLFSETAVDHESELIDLDTFYDRMIELKDKRYENVIIKNNGLQNSDFDDVLAEMELLRILSPDFKIFYTFPVMNDGNSYASLNNAQMDFFKEELLLTKSPYLERIADKTETRFGSRYDIGLVAKENILLSNQYMNNNVLLSAGTKIYRFQSWEYSNDAIDLMQEFSGLKVDGNSRMKFLHN